MVIMALIACLYATLHRIVIGVYSNKGENVGEQCILVLLMREIDHSGGGTSHWSLELIFYVLLIASWLYWHEREAFQRSAFGRSTAGNDVVATILISLFFSSTFSPFSAVTFSHRGSARIKKLTY